MSIKFRSFEKFIEIVNRDIKYGENTAPCEVISGCVNLGEKVCKNCPLYSYMKTPPPNMSDVDKYIHAKNEVILHKALGTIKGLYDLRI